MNRSQIGLEVDKGLNDWETIDLAFDRHFKIEFPASMAKTDVEAFQKVMPEMVSLMAERRSLLGSQQRQELVHFLLRDVPMKSIDIRLARLEARALERVYTGTEWLSADEIGVLGGHGQANPGAAANRWKTKKQLFAIRREGKDMYPRYTLSDNFTPLPAVKDVLEVLKNWDALRVAVWFESTSSFLAGKHPRELISLNGDVVVKAAHDAVERLND